MNKRFFLSLYVIVFFFVMYCSTIVLGAQRYLHEDTSKKCAICHYQWVPAFYLENRSTPIARPDEKGLETFSQEMCISCHDSSVRDSRRKICDDPGHQVGRVPSKEVTIPPEFPLDEQGRLKCTTCHTPHAVTEGSDSMVEYFLRAPNEDSSFCRVCHTKKLGGLSRGNHPLDISAQVETSFITRAGGKFGQSVTNQIICETCHTAHGGVNEKFLVLPVEDVGSLSILCEACHTTHAIRPGKEPRRTAAHPVDVVPGRIVEIPTVWTSGEKVVLGKKGELVCRTCHKPHNANREFLIAIPQEKGELCLQCHREQSRITGSSHDLRKSAPEEKNILNKQAQETGPCASCHLVHRGVGNFMWARDLETDDGNSSQFCTNCHSQGECAEGSLPGDFSHPMGLSLPDSIDAVTLPLFDQTGKQSPGGTISCSTCHDVHNPRFLPDDNTASGVTAELFLRIPSNQDPSAICIPCHREQGQIVNTKHDLRFSDRPFHNTLGNTPQNAGICSPCHVAHNAATQQYLWPGPLNQANSVEIPGQTKPHSTVMVMMCTTCHSDATLTSSTLPSYTFHPAGLVFPESTTSFIWEQFPLFSESGSPAPDGDVSCATCHNPHQWNASAKAEPSDTDTGGPVLSSFLRQGIDRKLCASCHGEESLFKFLYFHRSNSRKEVPFPQLLRRR